MLVTMLALAAPAHAGPSSPVANALSEIARDKDQDAGVRLRAAIALIDLMEAEDANEAQVAFEPPQVPDLDIPPEVTDPCDDDAVDSGAQQPPAHLIGLYASATSAGSLQIEAKTDRPVRAMHYLHERGDQRHWVLWLEGVEADAQTVQVEGGIASEVRVMQREGVVAIVATLSSDTPVKVDLQELDAGWQLVLGVRSDGMM